MPLNWLPKARSKRVIVSSHTSSDISLHIRLHLAFYSTPSTPRTVPPLIPATPSKFADDTTVLDLIFGKDESGHRTEVE